MTPIAYKDGVVAYDSQITSGNTITYDDYLKCHEVEGDRFFMCGKICDYSALQNTYFGAAVTKEVEASAIVADGEGMVCRCWCSGCILEEPDHVGLDLCNRLRDWLTTTEWMLAPY